jgi:predicted double-glycine peptidase
MKFAAGRKKFGVTPADLREAVKKVGNSAEAVEKELAGR